MTRLPITEKLLKDIQFDLFLLKSQLHEYIASNIPESVNIDDAESVLKYCRENPIVRKRNINELFLPTRKISHEQRVSLEPLYCSI